MTTERQIQLAKHRRDKAAHFVKNAITCLQQAQEEITNVEGKGSADLYSEIADHYDSLRPLVGKLERLEVTGLFE